MKKLIIILLFFFNNSWADKLSFTKMSIVPDFSINFILESDSDESFANLDCQSFIKKLDFYSDQENLISENYISIEQCEYLYKMTNSCFAQGTPKCFNTDDILTNSCLCK